MSKSHVFVPVLDRALCGLEHPSQIVAQGEEPTCVGCRSRMDRRPARAPLEVVAAPPMLTEHERRVAKLEQEIRELRGQRDDLRADLMAERRRAIDLEAKDRFHRLAHEMVEDGRMPTMTAFYNWVANYLDIAVEQVHSRMLSAAQVDAVVSGSRAFRGRPERSIDKEAMG